LPLRQSSPPIQQLPVKVWHRYTQVRGRLGPLGQRRNLKRWTTAASSALPGRRLNAAQTLVKYVVAETYMYIYRSLVVVSVLRADTELLERCRALEQMEKDQEPICKIKPALSADLISTILLKVTVKLYYH